LSLGLPALLSAISAWYTPAVVTFPGQAAEGLSAVQRVVDAVLDTAVDVAREKLLVYQKDYGRVSRCCRGFIGDIRFV